jgi:hypothetical protein
MFKRHHFPHSQNWITFHTIYIIYKSFNEILHIRAVGRTECPVVSFLRRTISRMGRTMSVTDRYFKAWILTCYKFGQIFPQSPGNGISETLNLKISPIESRTCGIRLVFSHPPPPPPPPPPNQKVLPTALHINHVFACYSGFNKWMQSPVKLHWQPNISTLHSTVEYSSWVIWCHNIQLSYNHGITSSAKQMDIFLISFCK